MNFHLNSNITKDLRLLHRPVDDIIDLCRAAFEYLCIDNEKQKQLSQQLSDKYEGKISSQEVEQTLEALIGLLIEVAKTEVSKTQVQKALREAQVVTDDDALEVLGQFVTSKRNFIESSIKSANIRAYRLVNLEWRLEVKLASRSLLKQSQVQVTMKLFLHTEPKSENRDLLIESEDQVIHPDERRNRKDLVVKTDVNSLLYIIKTLEEAMAESKTRRIRNIVKAIH